jgi:hypothetical protein
MKALRTCKHCGLMAITYDGLLLFMVNDRSKYGRKNICKLCHTVIQTGKNRNVPTTIVGPHTKLGIRKLKPHE